MNNLEFEPPEELTVSLWRSLVLNIIDRIAPERLPPLQVTSKPVHVGLMVGDLMEMPWYRTVFTNIADVVSPEMLPPLELTSSPVDVGELLGDEIAHPWWDSLLGNLRDRLSPERVAPLELTSPPFAPWEADTWLQILDWSSLLDTPKVYLPDTPRAEATYSAAEPPPEVAPAVPAFSQEVLAAQMQFKRDISRSRFRQKIWISLVAAQVAFLVFAIVKLS
ncbi:MAG TPA: hypothetical protein VMU45_03950 [Candidatus Eisenbacteria bacterium]|nr:hypothetical protein [Candidatus Eisenbacteria bacterium]